MTLLVEPDPARAEGVRFAIGGEVYVLDTLPDVGRRLAAAPGELLVVVGPDVDLQLALDLASAVRLDRPHVGVILMRHRIDVAVLGEALRAGVREVVLTEDLGGLAAACSRSLELSRRHVGETSPDGEQSYGRVVTVFSAKGGCGKTTVATNLAATLAAGGQSRVCLVDLDLAFGDVAIALQLVPAHTITDAVAMVGTIDEQGVAAIITPHSPGLDTVLAPVEPGEAEKIDVKLVSELVRVLRRLYDYVVIDTPPAFTEHVLAAFDVSDAYVLLATLDIPALKNLHLTLEMLDLLGYPRSSWMVVLNRADSKVGLSVAEVEQTVKVPIAVQIPSSRSVSASVNRGVPIVLDEPNHAVSQAVRRLAGLTIAQIGQPDQGSAAVAPSERRRGLRRRAGAR